MTDHTALIEALEPVAWLKPDWQNPATYDGHSPVTTYPTNGWIPLVPAATITALQAEVERLREALEWYGEQARLCRLIHREGDEGRANLSADGGSKARAALTKPGGSTDG